MDNYDVVFCCGEHQRAEVEENNKIKKTKNKKKSAQAVAWALKLFTS